MAKIAHSDKFTTVQTYHMRGLWNADKLKNAVEKGWITKAEYKELTGEAYE
jgi:uncharacterized XkdX family phage protein